MTINRNNYEEYFLLYTDNELSVAEKNMVDAFVAANPDLQEELLMLQQSVIKAAEIDFPGKDGLMKPEPVDTVTEEKLLLLLDNELKGKDKAAILSLIQYNKAVKHEWEILKQTKCSSEDIIEFKHKALLYRKKEGKVVAIKWWRVAAAAMLIGFGLWGAVSYLDSGKPSNPVIETAATETMKNKGNNDSNGPRATSGEQPVSSTQQLVTSDKYPATSHEPRATSHEYPATSIQHRAPSHEQPASTQTPDENSTNEVARNSKEPEVNEPLESFNNDNSNERVFVNVTPETQNSNIKNNIEPSAVPDNIAINTVFKESDAGDNNTFAFEEDEDKPRKTKLGGFFKRVKRVIERKTKIKTGNDDEVRIANMSFAMH